MGDLIQNHNDPGILEALIQETLVCASLDPATMRSVAESMVAEPRASRATQFGSHETRLALGVLRDAIRRMASTPGQRIIVLASPGFITPEDHQETMDVMDRAIRANVTINTVDGRGPVRGPVHGRQQAGVQRAGDAREVAVRPRRGARPVGRAGRTGARHGRHFFPEQQRSGRRLPAHRGGAGVLLPAGFFAAESEAGRIVSRR